MGGGEPFLHPNFIELVEYIKHKKLQCVINTNGILLEKFAQPLIDSGIDSIDISIDAPAEIHDQIRQFKGAFEGATAGIRKIVEIKKEKSLEKPRIIIYATISELSYRYIWEVVDIAEGLQVDSLTFLYCWFTNEETGREYSRIFRDSFQYEPTTWKGFLINVSKIDCEGLARSVNSIGNSRRDLPVSFAPKLRISEIAKYYDDLTFIPNNKRRCLSPWFSCCILPTGEVTPCADFPDYIVGNVKEGGFLRVWNNDRFRYFRKVLKKHKLFPICTRCCGLYNY